MDEPKSEETEAEEGQVSPGTPPIADFSERAPALDALKLSQALHADNPPPPPNQAFNGVVTEPTEKDRNQTLASVTNELNTPSVEMGPRPTLDRTAIDLSGNLGVKEKPVAPKEAPTPDLSGGDLSPIRTFRGDLAEAIQAKDISLARMVIKESEKREEEENATAKKEHGNILAFLLALALILIGAGILGYVFFLRGGNEAEQNQALFAPPLIFSDITSTLDITGLSPEEIRARLTLVIDENLRIGAIKNLVVAETIARGEQNSLITIPLTGFFSVLSLDPPERLPRFLEPAYMLGIHSFKTNTAFLLLKTKAFQGAFAEMLAWEPRLGEKIYPVLAGRKAGPELKEARWQDEVVANIDIRILQSISTSTPETFLLWSFLGTRDTLFIGINKDTLEEVITRLKTPAVTR